MAGIITKTKCKCGNDAEPYSDVCDWCGSIAGEAPHVGHYSRLGGTWFCDTCESPYCELA